MISGNGTKKTRGEASPSMKSYESVTIMIFTVMQPFGLKFEKSPKISNSYILDETNRYDHGSEPSTSSSSSGSESRTVVDQSTDKRTPNPRFPEVEGVLGSNS